ncbi:MAG: HAMP domain-containing histidine kinase [Lewinellaceae bacterium]|nr:HAMP domain-containing histidine kinase [Lewinellaceae bacterium]
MRPLSIIRKEGSRHTGPIQPTPWWRGLSLFIIVYLILAFTWWAVLLHIKNHDAFHAKIELLRMGMITEGIYESEAQLMQTPTFLSLESKYRHQEWMIIGESAVFVISLVVSMALINRSYQKEMRAALHQHNFLLSITHELKSPLASIRLVLETLLKKELPPDKVQYISQRALRETDRLTQLVNNLLLSARLETAYTPLLEPVPLVKLIREALTEFSENHPDASIHFSRQKELMLLQGDREGLLSVLLNLLENAVKYSEGPPEIEITLRQADGKIYWAIADQGIGIDEREKNRIFEKFYRVGNEDTRKNKGTGLGLFIVREIIRAHGGRITVTDNQPRGTVFNIELKNKVEELKS